MEFWLVTVFSTYLNLSTFSKDFQAVVILSCIVVAWHKCMFNFVCLHIEKSPYWPLTELMCFSLWYYAFTKYINIISTDWDLIYSIHIHSFPIFLGLSDATLKSNGDKASLFFFFSRPFWIGSASDTFLPMRTLL